MAAAGGAFRDCAQVATLPWFSALSTVILPPRWPSTNAQTPAARKGSKCQRETIDRSYVELYPRDRVDERFLKRKAYGDKSDERDVARAQ